MSQRTGKGQKLGHGDSTRSEALASVVRSERAKRPSEVSKFATFRPFLQYVGVLVFGIFAWRFFQNSGPTLENLVNAPQETLRTAFQGKDPYLFYCDTSEGSLRPPSTFDQLRQQTRTPTPRFAALNCSQTLPSGKTIADRFSLTYEGTDISKKPTILATAPWIKPKTLTFSALRDVNTLDRLVTQVLRPVPKLVASDKEYQQACRFTGKATASPKVEDPTCILLIRGARYSSSTHGSLEEQLVRTYSHLPVVAADGKKWRLSTELRDTGKVMEMEPEENFAIRVHAIRNGTHVTTMGTPLTWDYVDSFVSHSSMAPLTAFEGPRTSKSKNGTPTLSNPHLVRSSLLKKRIQRQAELRDSRRRNRQKMASEAAAHKSRREEELDEEKDFVIDVDMEDDTIPKSQPNNQVPEDLAAQQESLEEQRLARERSRREEMDRQASSLLFEDEDDYDENDEEDDEDEEDIIML